MQNAKEIHQFTHGDLDGVGCAMLATLAFENMTLPRYVDYNDVDAVVQDWLKHYTPGSALLITDICPNVNIVNRIKEDVKRGSLKALVIDHHATTKWLGEFNEPYLIHDQSACGTKLFYRWLLDNAAENWRLKVPDLEKLVHKIDVYDRWLTNDPARPSSECLNRLYWALGADEFIRSFTEDFNADEKHHMRFLDSVMRDKEERTITNALADQLEDENFYVDKEGRRFLLLMSVGNVSKLGHAALDEESDIEYVAMLNPLYNKVELRSRKGGTNVAEIAKKFGGGGHPAAAGFQFPFGAVLRTIFGEGWF